MSTIPAWYSVSRPWPPSDGSGQQPGPARLGQLGLGADHWPPDAISDSMQPAVEAAFDWYSIPTFGGEEWCRLVADESIALRCVRPPLRRRTRLTVLRYDLQASGSCLGWDIGPPQGGHSAIPHEVYDPRFAAHVDGWLNPAGLFRSHRSAVEFWTLRSDLNLPEWEEPSGWAIVRVSVLFDTGTDPPQR